MVDTYNEFVAWLLRNVAALFGSLSESVLTSFSMDSLFFDQHVPYFSTIESTIRGIAIVLCVSIYLVSLFKNLLAPFNEELYENPLRLTVRFFVSLIFCVIFPQILQAMIDVFTAFYNALINIETTADGLEKFKSVTVQQNGSVTDGANAIVAAFGIVFPQTLGVVAFLIALIVVVVLFMEFMKLLLEIIMRYIVINIGVVFAPLAACQFVSKTTHKVFWSYFKMMMSALLLFTINAIFIRAAVSCMGTIGISDGNNVEAGYMGVDHIVVIYDGKVVAADDFARIAEHGMEEADAEYDDIHFRCQRFLSSTDTDSFTWIADEGFSGWAGMHKLSGGRKNVYTNEETGKTYTMYFRRGAQDASIDQSFIVWFIFIVGLMRIGTMIDKYLQSLGLSVAQTGGDLLGEMIGAAHQMATIGSFFGQTGVLKSGASSFKAGGGFSNGIQAGIGNALAGMGAAGAGSALGGGLAGFAGRALGGADLAGGKPGAGAVKAGEKMLDMAGKGSLNAAQAHTLANGVKSGLSAGIEHSDALKDAMGMKTDANGITSFGVKDADGNMKNYSLGGAMLSADKGTINGTTAAGGKFTIGDKQISSSDVGFTDAAGNQKFLHNAGDVPLSFGENADAPSGSLNSVFADSESATSVANAVSTATGGNYTADNLQASVASDGSMLISDANGNVLGTAGFGDMAAEDGATVAADSFGGSYGFIPANNNEGSFGAFSNETDSFMANNNLTMGSDGKLYGQSADGTRFAVGEGNLPSDSNGYTTKDGRIYLTGDAMNRYLSNDAVGGSTGRKQLEDTVNAKVKAVTADSNGVNHFIMDNGEHYRVSPQMQYKAQHGKDLKSISFAGGNGVISKEDRYGNSSSVVNRKSKE